jgi:hypothetical protein
MYPVTYQVSMRITPNSAAEARQRRSKQELLVMQCFPLL